jgi:hypothetical protein
MNNRESAQSFRIRMLKEAAASEGCVNFFASQIQDGRFVRFDPDSDKVFSSPPFLFGWPMPTTIPFLVSCYGDGEAIKELQQRLLEHHL